MVLDPEEMARFRNKAATVLWLAAMGVVIAGELLGGASAPIHWVRSTGIGDKAVHYGAYTVLAGIPPMGFAQPGGILSALSMILLGLALEFAHKLALLRSFATGRHWLTAS